MSLQLELHLRELRGDEWWLDFPADDADRAATARIEALAKEVASLEQKEKAIVVTLDTLYDHPVAHARTQVMS